MAGYFITGTGTDIGKTWLSAALLRHWRTEGLATRAIKPVMSGVDGGKLNDTDAGQLLLAQGLAVTTEAVTAMAPWRFAAPLSPDMAAAREGRAIEYASLVAFTREARRRMAATPVASVDRRPAAATASSGGGPAAGGGAATTSGMRRGVDCDGIVDRRSATAEVSPGEAPLLVEGVGGVMVPLDARHTVLDWIVAAELPAVLVAGSYLGSLSHTLTALAALAARGVPVAAVVVNETPESTVPLADTLATLSRHVTAAAGGVAPPPVVGVARADPAPGVAALARILRAS